MSTETHSCEIVLPGYTLTERIGSGGYAEVWRAEAPGGIEKAVKIVYGYYDDEFASQELKALERIKGVRHPFLLSLERFEILNGRLAILTELADMSLDQRLRQCRGEGLIGIPRDELIRYMADAAEALDFLSQRHSLLHLDIKPENLLLLGDHIKVADFGLVKEIATRTQNSLVSGMTPTYAAPEIFDDDPSTQSDQYSLAIVYQEMLVGTLPFPGRTAAQLAKQHTSAEPQLASVPAGDRPVLARALAKNPADRFESCKAFVDALQGRRNITGNAPPTETSRPTPVAPVAPSPESDDTKPPSFHPTIRVSPDSAPKPGVEQFEVQVTQPVRRAPPVAVPPRVEPAPQEPFVPEETIDVAAPTINGELARRQPTLYIAAGGGGLQVLCRLLPRIHTGHESDTANALFESIAIDTDRDELRQACSSQWKAPLCSDDTLHVPLKLPQNYDDSGEILNWVSRRWLYNIPRSLETRGYRPLGRLALIDHSHRVIEIVRRKLKTIAGAAGAASAAGGECDSTIKVVLLASMGGGTGAGMVVDIGNAVKSQAEDQNLQVEIHAYLLCTCLTGSNASPLLAANTYALLAELNHTAAHGNQSAIKKAPLTELFESPASPFDHIYCVPARPQKADAHAIDAADMLASYLALDQSAEARAALRSCRSISTPSEQLQPTSLKLRKLGCAALGDQTHAYIHELSIELADAVKRHWISADTSADWNALVRAAQRQSERAKQPTVGIGDAESSPAPTTPTDDASPIALRGRFDGFKSLQLASEVIRQIETLREARDHRGRPRIVPRDAFAIVASAKALSEVLVSSQQSAVTTTDRFAASPRLRNVITIASQRVLGREIQSFDPTHPERCLALTDIVERIQADCLSLLQECFADPGATSVLAALINTNSAASAMLTSATSNLLGCGCDRRTIVFVPRGDQQESIVQELRRSRPLAAVMPADVDDVIVVSEESAMSPRSVARGLGHMYPGIAEAAHRLHTRTDIEWERLV